MKEDYFAILKLRDQLKTVCVDLQRLQQADPEKYANEIINLREIATAIRLKMESYRSEKASERIARRGR